MSNRPLLGAGRKGGTLCWFSNLSRDLPDAVLWVVAHAGDRICCVTLVFLQAATTVAPAGNPSKLTGSPLRTWQNHFFGTPPVSQETRNMLSWKDHTDSNYDVIRSANRSTFQRPSGKCVALPCWCLPPATSLSTIVSPTALWCTEECWGNKLR